MEVEKRVKILAALMSVSTAANFMNLRPGDPLKDQLLILLPIILFAWLVIYHFYYGRNWARILVLAGAVFSLSNFLFLLASTSAFQFFFSLFDGCLAIYLLNFLNTPDAKLYFKAVGQDRPKQSWVRTFASVLVVIGVLAGLIVLGSSVFARKIGKTQVWMEDLASGQARAITAGGMNTSPVFSSDGERVLFISREGLKKEAGSSLRIYSVKDGSVQTLFENKLPMWGVSWAPDQRSVLFSQGEKTQELWRYSLEDKSLTQLAAEPGKNTDALLSPDNEWMLIAEENEKKQKFLSVVPVKGGEKKQVSEPGNFLNEPKYPVWSPDSSKAAYLSFMNLIIYDVKTGQKESIVLNGLNNVMDIVFFPNDMDRLLVKARPADSAAFSYNLYSVSRKTGKIEILKSRRKMMEMQYDISRDGGKIVYTRV